MFETGLVSVSFRELSPDEVISSAKKSGLDFIEWGSDIHAPCDDKNRLFSIKAAQESAGISCCSYGTYFRFGKNQPFEIESYIIAAKLLGTNILRVWCGKKGFLEYSAAEKKQLLNDCAAAARIAEQFGVILCSECHHDTITDCLEGALELMKFVNTPHFKMYWQPNQYKSIAENIRYAKGISSFTTHIHVFNWDADRKYPLEQGISVWQQYLSAFSGDHMLLSQWKI